MSVNIVSMSLAEFLLDRHDWLLACLVRFSHNIAYCTSMFYRRFSLSVCGHNTLFDFALFCLNQGFICEFS